MPCERFLLWEIFYSVYPKSLTLFNFTVNRHLCWTRKNKTKQDKTKQNKSTKNKKTDAWEITQLFSELRWNLSYKFTSHLFNVCPHQEGGKSLYSLSTPRISVRTLLKARNQQMTSCWRLISSSFSRSMGCHLPNCQSSRNNLWTKQGRRPRVTIHEEAVCCAIFPT